MHWVRGDDAGAVAVITAIVSIVLFSVAALTVDIGRLWETRRQAQSDVDLATLAGALFLPKQPKVACQKALQYLRDNTPGGNGSASGIDNDTACTATGTADKQVEITNDATRITLTTPRRTVDFGLATVMGISNGHTSATATAEIRSPNTGIEPFFLNASEHPGVSCLKDGNGGGGGGHEALRVSLVSLATPEVVTIAGISPQQGYIAGGDDVVISGVGFTNQSTVLIDGTAVAGNKVKFDNKTNNLTLTTPQHVAGQVQITVQTGTETSAGKVFTYYDPALTMTPASGTTLGGTQVDITGDFPAGSAVSWAGTPLVPLSPATKGKITVLTPVHPAGPAGVLVTNPSTTNGQWTGTFSYTVAAYLLTLAPASGGVGGGDTVTLTSVGGPAFSSSSVVTWDGQPLASTFRNNTGLTVVTPQHAPTAVQVTVTTGGQTTQPATFTYTPQAIILTPNVGLAAGGNQVVISSTDAPAFTDTSTVTWDGKTITANYNKQA